MPEPILLTGGTGTLGRLVTPLLLAAGQRVRILSRHQHAPADGVEYLTGDLDTGTGVDAAVAGARTVLNLAGSQQGDGDKARHLVAAAKRAGVEHLVHISVVGADRVPVVSAIDRGAFGYFASKLEAEQVVAGSGIPWTTLRASQFHELTLVVARAMAKLPVIPVPAGVRFQPVDGGEVAARLARLTLGPPAGLVPDLAGPHVVPMGDLIRAYLRATGRRRPIVPVPMAGRAYRAIRAGANLAPEHADGRRTWEQFLADQVAAAVA
jgi:uncharacterized protein YbjT (DUF2867 family)